MAISAPWLALTAEATTCRTELASDGDGECATGRHCRALIIGNKNYGSRHRTVLAAQADVAVMRETLGKTWKFAVETTEDADSACAKQQWGNFLKALEDAPIAKNLKSLMAVFYFSGHGMDHGSDSLLLPVDAAPPEAPETILSQSISLQKAFDEFKALQDRLEKRSVRLHGVFIIDACRVLLKDNVPGEVAPATVAFAKAGGATQGMSPVLPPQGLFALYAASRGQVARTHTGAGANYVENTPSVFTGHLRNLLTDAERKNIRLQLLAEKVQWRTYQSTYTPGGESEPQTPDHFDRMTGSIINIAGDPVTEADPEIKEPNKPIPISKARNKQVLWERPRFPKLVVIDQASGVAALPGELPCGPADSGGSMDAAKCANLDDALHKRFDHPPRIAVGRTEVTESEFHAFLKDRNSGDARLHSDLRQDNKRPMTGVTWKDARDYVAWLNKEAGLTEPATWGEPESDQGYYRLPTEAEWEYAARGGITGDHVHGGDDGGGAKLCQFGNGADKTLKSSMWTNALCTDLFGRKLAPVGSFAPNTFGLYDMIGNAWEWVGDCSKDGLGRPRAIFESRYGCAYEANPSSAPATCVRDDGCARHVARGGSWLSGPESMTLTSRTSFPTLHARSTLGFRVVRVLARAEVSAPAR